MKLRFITFTHAGIKEEAQPCKFYATSHIAAVLLYDKMLRDYLKENKARYMLWKWNPVIEANPDDKNQFRIISRFAILTEADLEKSIINRLLLKFYFKSWKKKYNLLSIHEIKPENYNKTGGLKDLIKVEIEDNGHQTSTQSG